MLLLAHVSCKACPRTVPDISINFKGTIGRGPSQPMTVATDPCSEVYWTISPGSPAASNWSGTCVLVLWRSWWCFPPHLSTEQVLAHSLEQCPSLEQQKQIRGFRVFANFQRLSTLFFLNVKHWLIVCFFFLQHKNFGSHVNVVLIWPPFSPRFRSRRSSETSSLFTSTLW